MNKRYFALCGLSILMCIAGCSKRSETAQLPDQALSKPVKGGTATVLLDAAFAGSWPAGLDPATNPNGGANLSLMNAIYGGLFQLVADADGRNARVEGVLATGYQVSDDGRRVTISLRPDLKFSDGTPFDADAVRFSIERALASKCSCSPNRWPWDPSGAVTIQDARTVTLNFKQPYGPVINAIPASNLNWIVSPAAVKTLGEKFALSPVGAGPFKVTSNTLSHKIVLQRNPLWWQTDRPYLDELVFQSIGGDQAAYQALLAGDAQAYEGMTSIDLIELAKGEPALTVTLQPPVSSGFIQLNSKVPPLNNQRAREALYYATDSTAIRKGIFKDAFPTSQSFTASGGLFHHDGVAGYRGFDPAKARAIVAELGGIHIKLETLRSPAAEQVVTALQTQWKNVGIDVEIETLDLGALINRFSSGRWNTMYQTIGAYDPDVGSGLGFRFGIDSIFSGTRDQELEALLSQAIATTDSEKRDSIYRKVSVYLSEHALAPFLVSSAPAQVTNGLYGPGLTTPIPSLLVNTGVIWQDVWRKPQ